MKRWVALSLSVLFALQPCATLAQGPAPAGEDTRLYLADGSVVTGHLIENSRDLVIIKVGDQVFTFDKEKVDKIITPESLGAQARTVTVTEFPYISFLGGTVAFGLLSWLQFDRSSQKEHAADLNAENGIKPQEIKLRDQADRARLLGWGSATLAVGSLAVALVPHKSTRRVFPELSFGTGTPSLKLACRLSF